MDAKNKAKELYDKFEKIFIDANADSWGKEAKQCAAICVREIIDELQGFLNLGYYMQPPDREIQTDSERERFWNEVLNEIEKM